MFALWLHVMSLSPSLHGTEHCFGNLRIYIFDYCVEFVDVFAFVWACVLHKNKLCGDTVHTSTSRDLVYFLETVVDGEASPFEYIFVFGI